MDPLEEGVAKSRSSEGWFSSAILSISGYKMGPVISYKTVISRVTTSLLGLKKFLNHAY